MSNTHTILIADSEPGEAALISAHLQAAAYHTHTLESGRGTLLHARERLPSLLIIDLVLPDMSGLEVCRTLKNESKTANLPIIILSAKADEVDRIVGFELGADDYLAKPFSPRELVLRVKSVLRRTVGVQEVHDRLTLGPISMQRSLHEVTVGDRFVQLTATEFKVLALLIERRGRVQSRATLLKDVWGQRNATGLRRVDALMRRLREKLGPFSTVIESIRGFGYRASERSTLSQE